MPERRFDGRRLRSARTAAGFTQTGLSKALGVSRSAVTTWEKGRGPDPERLPAIAEVLNWDLNSLFPRAGAPDLADLRCDAGFAQYEIEKLVRGKDAARCAERGVRRLTPALASAFADAYGVSEAELRAAEDRSFGDGGAPGGAAPADEKDTPIPTTLAEKITYLLEQTYSGAQDPPSDADIAHGINKAAGSPVITAAGVEDLRTGVVTEASAVIREGLAETFGVTAFFFQPDDLTIVRTIVEGLQTLKLVRSGDIQHIATRGIGPEGLPAELLAAVNDLVANLPELHRPEPGKPDGDTPAR
ncbi:helix-turn-helix domain-containing protein [Streptomyces sp. p1417]|uniref:Helix-turn-helix domain-containing protein n=1 Tax=Streptomyces typhae TaxID=2681492 RepID=A0A6L6WUB9_9ACTN|nr:helix-turn-helix transcriptional regulator [Streptomyces typhae]MVO85277.1 helix-turn-helix domain-containing protein [Streptomyces typhae]